MVERKDVPKLAVTPKDVRVIAVFSGVETVGFYNYEPEGTRPQRRKFFKDKAYEALAWEIANNPNYLKKFIRLEMDGDNY